MTLHKRTLLVIGLTVVAAVAVLYASSQLILSKSYEQLEIQDTAHHLQRAVNTLNADIGALKLIALNWSRWDDVRDFIRQPRSNFAKNFAEDDINRIFMNTDLDIVLFLNTRGDVTFEKVVDARTKMDIAVPSALRNHLRPGSPLLDHPNIYHEISGIMSLPQGHLELVSLPVSNSRAEGSLNGYLIWGRFLTDDVVARIAGIAGLNINVSPYSTDQFDTLRNTAVLSGSTYVQTVNEERIAGFGFINDVFGRPSLMLSIQIPRLIYAQGNASSSYFVVALIVVMVVAAGVWLALLERTVLSRLASLNASISRIRLTNDLATPITVKGDDELGSLATGMKTLLASLQQSHAKLEEANRELEQRMTERTADLSQANARLQQEITERQQTQIELALTRDQALEALSLKTQILASISHDSRIPLTTIHLNTERLQLGHYGDINEKQRSVLDSIMTSSQQLLSYINQLLDEAHISSGRMQLAHIPLEPKQLLDDIVKVLLPLAERKGIELKAEIAPDVPARLLGDPARLKQIVTNLADNALKFTDRGAVEVRLARKDIDHWLLQVRDSGPGIPADLQPRIFEAYWQINSTATHDTNRGVGLGLSIVRQLVTLMKGEISVQSTPENGSTFTVTLPIEEGTSEPTLELAGQPG